MSLLKKSWIIKTPYSNLPLLDRVVKHRNLDFEHELANLHSPWLMKNMKKAVERVLHAIKKQERIMIFGDYDVDGVCGSSILYQGLGELGANVSVRLPHRERDGYGLNMKVIDECAELGVKVLITVDCGISSVEPIACGVSKGIDIIVTDHHAIPKKLPDSFAILNPKQKDCHYPEKEIVGAVVAFKLLCAIFESCGVSSEEICQYLDLSALATVADCAPLTGENRLIVKMGLEQLRQTKHRGLRKLVESYDLRKSISSYHLGFLIAPCINAAGRLEDPKIAFQMLLGDETKADYLRSLNEERQQMMHHALEQLIEEIKQTTPDAPFFILRNDEWSAGIIGLLAGKIAEKYHRPTICLTKLKDTLVGSCRSVPELNMVEWISQYQKFFLGFGGHHQAAGLRMKPEQFHDFQKKCLRDMENYVKKHPFESKLVIDTEMLPTEITFKTVSDLLRLEPFGMSNPKPKFLMKRAQVGHTRVVGKDGNHLQLRLLLKNRIYKAVAFQMAEHQQTLDQWKTIDLVCSLQDNEFRGERTVDLQILDAKKA